MSTDLVSILNDQPSEAATEQVEETSQAQETPQSGSQATEQVETGEQASATPAEQQEDPVDKHRKGLEAAALAERRKRQELEQRLEQREREFQQREREFQQRQQAVAQPSQGEPQREQFGSDAEFFKALVRFEAKQEAQQLMAAERAEQEQERQRQAQETQAREFQRKSDETVDAGRKQYADFDAVINDGLAPFLNPVLQEALVIGGGSDVAYWLGKNPTEAARVSQLPPMQMVLEIGRLEAKVKAQAQPAKPSLPQTLTQARNAAGQFAREQPYDGPTPLDAILATKK